MATETKEAVTGQILLEQSDSIHFINASFKIRKELPYGVYGINQYAGFIRRIISDKAET